MIKIGEAKDTINKMSNTIHRIETLLSCAKREGDALVIRHLETERDKYIHIQSGIMYCLGEARFFSDYDDKPIIEDTDG